jgi:hypothetical protein
VNPLLTCSWSTSRKNTEPSAPYTRNVIRFAAVKIRDANSSVGTIAPGCRSTRTNPTIPATPTAAASQKTVGSLDLPTVSA